jgi:hypothetical protein
VDENVICYGNAGVPKPEMSDEVLRFTDYWKEQAGSYPKELVFDSRLTTYTNLQKLTERGVSFITLRRRTRKMIAGIFSTPEQEWQRVTLPALTANTGGQRRRPCSERCSTFQARPR